MTCSLRAKNVFLTGGAQGLGKSFVDGLLASGARVVFGDINPSVGAETEREFVEKYGKGNVKFIAFDVTDGAKFEEAFQTAVEHLGYVDLMVNNAGLMIESLWEKMILVNYAGVVRGTLLAYEHMRKDKGGRGGRIINLSSEMGLHDVASVPVYCGTKHAVRAFTSCFAKAPDIKQIGIEYGILCPGPAKTDLTTKIDETRIRHFTPELKSSLKKVTSSVERIQSGLMKLLLLENMNGAILYVQVDQMNFYKMDKFNLGERWPLTKDVTSSVSFKETTISPTLKTKNVFLTSGARGLGKSFVDCLLADGARVVFGDIDPTAGAATEKEFVKKYGRDKVRYVVLDVTDGSKFEETFQTAVNYLGYVDLMVNNADILDESLWEKTIQLNYWSVVKGTFTAYEHMRKDKGGRGGRIVNISSHSGLDLVESVPVYCGTKQAVRSFTTSLAKAPDLERLGIEYGVLCPGVGYFALSSKEDVKKTSSSVAHVQQGFRKLVLLHDMNGAILYVPVDHMNFYSVKKVKLGQSWPVPQSSSDLTVSTRRKSAL